MTQRQLSALCRKWQKKFRLEGWKIRARFMGPTALVNAYGQVHYNPPNSMCAEIWILNPQKMAEIDPTCPIESTLVHELLHVILDGQKRETAINLLADILTTPRRKRKKTS